MTATALPASTRIAFIGGGNMASAIIGGLIRQGLPAARIDVVEPFEATRAALLQQHGVTALPAAGEALARCAVVVWAVKPQTFAEAAASVKAFAANALHLSVAAGIPSASIARWLGTERIVRAMPNTPALIGQGVTGLYADASVSAAERTQAEQVLAAVGSTVWVGDEKLIDAVTALSGSGPAYVFYFIEAMVRGGQDLGLTADQARALAIATFTGASALAAQSPESPATLRERVTSKGGTTEAALKVMAERGVKEGIVAGCKAAEARGQELGKLLGAG